MTATEPLTLDEVDELVTYLMRQSWHAANAVMIATDPDATDLRTRLAMFRITDQKGDPS